MDKLKFRRSVGSIVLRTLDRLSPGFFERAEVGKFAINHVRPLETTVGRDKFAPGRLLPMPGVTLDQEAQQALVRNIGEHRDLFPALRSSRAINTQHHQDGDKIHNGFFPTPDAETYAGMIAVRRPARIIEVGGGYSTLIARSTIDQLGLDTELIVIDPEPRIDVSEAATQVIRKRVEGVELSELQLPSGSFLFIDSSHLLRTGGDLVFLYGNLIPSLPAGITVHVHDIFLPFDYSQLGTDLWWTEQYLLQALLAHSPRYRIDLALRWLSSASPDLMADVYGSAVVEQPAHGGLSFWFSTV